jgi:hypothetical protein
MKFVTRCSMNIVNKASIQRKHHNIFPKDKQSYKVTSQYNNLVKQTKIS